MSRGRKSFSSNITDNWEKAFFNSIGHYITLINIGLIKSFKSEPLSNHIKIVGGYAFKNVEYKSAGIPIIRISDFNNERIILDNVVYYDESPNLEKYKLKESDIIIALTGGTIGKLGIVQAGLGKLYLNQRVGKFDILNPDEFEKEYIYWIARGVEGIVKNLAWGAAIPNVSPKQIEELNFPIPTKDKQKRIISFLNDLRNGNLNGEIYFDKEIEAEIKDIQQNQVIARKVQVELTFQLTQLENLNQAILQEAVQGKLVKQNPKDEQASELLKRIKAEKAKSGKKEKPLPPIKSDEIPFEIPESWVWCRLGDAVDLKRGKSKHRPRNDGRLFLDGTYPFIQTGDVSKAKNNDDLITTINGYYNDFGLDQSEMQSKGTLCITIAANIAECGFLDFDACVPDSIVCLSAIDKSIEIFIYHYLKLAKADLERFAPATAQKNINLGILNDLLIPLPPLSEQTRIVAEIEKQLAKTKQLNEHIIANQHATEQLLKALLHGAFEVEEKEEV